MQWQPVALPPQKQRSPQKGPGMPLKGEATELKGAFLPLFLAFCDWEDFLSSERILSRAGFKTSLLTRTSPSAKRKPAPLPVNLGVEGGIEQ